MFCALLKILGGMWIVKSIKLSSTRRSIHPHWFCGGACNCKTHCEEER